MGKQYTLSTIYKVKDDGSIVVKKVGTAFEELGKKSTKAGEQVETSSKRMKRSTEPLTSTKKNVKGFSDSLGGMLSSGVMKYASFAMIGMGLKNIADKGMEFNEAMANVGTLIPGNLKRLNELKDGIRSISAGLGLSNVGMAQGLYEVVSAYGDSSETLERMKVTAIAAKAGIASTGDSLNLLSQVTKEYGNNTADGMRKASDLAFMAVKEGQTNFAALAGSMSVVIPTAAQLKISQEELFATMATFTRGAQTTPVVVTQLNAVLTSLLAPTEQMASRLAELGYESGSAILEAKGLGETMRLLTRDGKETNENLVAMFGNVRATRLAMGFAGTGMDQYTDKLAKMKDASGATQAALNEQLNGINASGESYKKMIVALEDLKISFWDVAASPLGTFFEGLSSTFEGIGASAKLLKAVVTGGDVHEVARKLTEYQRNKLYASKPGAPPTTKSNGSINKELQKQGYAFPAFAASNVNKEKDIEKMEVRLVLPTDDEGNPIINANVRSSKAASITKQGVRPAVTQ